MAMAYSQRPGWEDVEPISQDDGPNPLVPIAYSSEYRMLMDYFRAIIRTGEKSQRVLDLLAEIIDMNPAHYTVWRYRQDVLFAIDADLNAELDYIDEIASVQSKGYQIWHHRQVVVDRLNDGRRELPFINQIIEEDSKNYHAWSYRQWVVSRFNYWDQEMAYTDDMLVFDVRNNSAWNHRHFILFERPSKFTEDDLDREIEFTQRKIQQAPNNPSGWTYLTAILEASSKPFDSIEPFLESLSTNQVLSPHLFAMWIDVFEYQAKKSGQPINPKALEMCDELAERLDTIRQKYWRHRKAQLAQKE